MGWVEIPRGYKEWERSRDREMDAAQAEEEEEAQEALMAELQAEVEVLRYRVWNMEVPPRIYLACARAPRANTVSRPITLEKIREFVLDVVFAPCRQASGHIAEAYQQDLECVFEDLPSQEGIDEAPVESGWAERWAPGCMVCTWDETRALVWKSDPGWEDHEKAFVIIPRGDL